MVQSEAVFFTKGGQDSALTEKRGQLHPAVAELFVGVATEPTGVYKEQVTIWRPPKVVE